MNSLPFRQIHLDFHTHESIEGIGADFDPVEFADTLVEAQVNSINLFARGHHGWMYYDSQAFPERKHPHLTRGRKKEDELRGTQVAAREGTEILADMVAPYFTRTWRHYCSHRHAPTTGEVYAPAVVMTGNTGYISQPIFSLYGDCAPQWARQLLKGVLDRLLPAPLVRLESVPHSLVVSVMRQPAQPGFRCRTLVHLLNYIPRRNNDKCDIVEDNHPIAPCYGAAADRYKRLDRPLRAGRSASAVHPRG